MDPKSVGAVSERNLSAHREHIRVDGHRQEHGGEYREHFHRQVELVGEERIVRRFESFDGFFLAFQNIPEANVRADHILKVNLGFNRNEGVIFVDDGLDDGSLGF